MDLTYKIDNHSFHARVSAIIYNQDKSKVLLSKVDGRDYYLLPGGKLRFHEDSLTAIKREIREEIGYDLEYTLCIYLYNTSTMYVLYIFRNSYLKVNITYRQILHFVRCEVYDF